MKRNKIKNANKIKKKKMQASRRNKERYKSTKLQFSKKINHNFNCSQFQFDKPCFLFFFFFCLCGRIAKRSKYKKKIII